MRGVGFASAAFLLLTCVVYSQAPAPLAPAPLAPAPLAPAPLAPAPLAPAALVSAALVSAAFAPAAPKPIGSHAEPTALFVKFRVKPGQNAAFEAAFRKMQRAIREQEPGNLYYDLFVTPEDPQLYVIMERYQDAAAVTAHNQTDHIKKVLAEIRDLMAAPLEPQRLIFVSSK